MHTVKKGVGQGAGGDSTGYLRWWGEASSHALPVLALRETEEEHITGGKSKGPGAWASLGNEAAEETVRSWTIRSEVRSFWIEISMAVNTRYVSNSTP